MFLCRLEVLLLLSTVHGQVYLNMCIICYMSLSSGHVVFIYKFFPVHTLFPLHEGHYPCHVTYLT